MRDMIQEGVNLKKEWKESAYMKHGSDPTVVIEPSGQKDKAPYHRGGKDS